MQRRNKIGTLLVVLLLCIALTACGGGSGGNGGNGGGGDQHQVVSRYTPISGADFSDAVSKALFFVHLQVNPELRVYLDDQQNVIAIEAINEDAKALFGSHYTVFHGPYQAFLEHFLDDARNKDYLKKGAQIQADLINKDGESTPEDAERLRQQSETVLETFRKEQGLQVSGTFIVGTSEIHSFESIDLADPGSGSQQGNQGIGNQNGGGNQQGNGSQQGNGGQNEEELRMKAEGMIMGNVASFEADAEGNIYLIVEEDSAGNRFEHRFDADGTLTSTVQTHREGEPIDPIQIGDNGQGNNGNQGDGNENQGSNEGQGAGGNEGQGGSGNSGSGGNEGWGAGGSSNSAYSGPPQGNPITHDILSKHKNGVPEVERETWADGAYRETVRYDDGRYNTITEVWADGTTYNWVYYTADEGGGIKTYGWYDPINNVRTQLNYTQDGTYAEGYRGKNKWYQWYSNGMCIKDVYDQGFLYTEILYDPVTGMETERYEKNYNTGGSFHEYYTADRKYRITEHFNSSGKLWEKVTCNLATGEVTSERY